MTMFKIGDEVYWDPDCEDPISVENLTKRSIDQLRSGTIKFVNEGEVGIATQSNRIYLVKVCYVCSAEDVKYKKSSLEEEYNKVQKEIAAQIKAGVDLIYQAEAKLNTIGCNIIDDYDLSRPVRGMIDQLGWSSSSLSC